MYGFDWMRMIDIGIIDRRGGNRWLRTLILRFSLDLGADFQSTIRFDEWWVHRGLAWVQQVIGQQIRIRLDGKRSMTYDLMSIRHRGGIRRKLKPRKLRCK